MSAPTTASDPPPGGSRGRPRGSVSLTPQIEQTIVSYVRAGAFPHVAAQAAGISPRTFHDWMARGEDRHSSRSSTPKLRAFARAVRTAQAEARIAAEVRVYREKPAQWLKYAARSTPDLEGWTEPRASGRNAGWGGLEQAIRALDLEEQDHRPQGWTDPRPSGRESEAGRTLEDWVRALGDGPED